jgi:hypothetical protein
VGGYSVSFCKAFSSAVTRTVTELGKAKNRACSTCHEFSTVQLFFQTDPIAAIKHSGILKSEGRKGSDQHAHSVMGINSTGELIITFCLDKDLENI